MDSALLVKLMESMDGAPVRLEYVSGTPYWEMMPGRRHHDALMGIRDRMAERDRQSGGGCECHRYAELLIAFPDGSFKTPDLSIFCEEPKEPEGAVTLVPEAVVEIVSPGYERKDLEIGPSFYLSQGVKDVVVFDPRSNLILHFRRDGNRTLIAPADIALECGCIVPIAAAS